MNSPFQTFIWIYLALSIFLLLYNLLALLWKRLHDRNRRALWLLLLPVMMIEVFLSFALGPISGVLGMLLPALLLIGLALVIWLLVETLFRCGTTGDNKYGPDPLSPLTPPEDGTI